MSSSFVLVAEERCGIVVITLNRAEKRNALNIPLLREFCTAVEAANTSPSARAVIVRGAGPVFCAGLDLREATEPELSEESARLIARMLESVYLSPKVTIAAVEGAAIAGGAGLMSCCDFVVAAEDARIGYPEVRRGLVAGLVMTLLRRQLRERDICELTLLGELVSAERALAMRLIDRVAPANGVMGVARELARSAAEGAPEAVARSKRWLRELWGRDFRADLEGALRLHQMMRAAPEAQEGMAAFLEKRTPRWRLNAE